MFDKIKYYLAAFGAGVVLVLAFFLGRRPKNTVDTSNLDERIDSKEKELEKIKNEEVKVDKLSNEETEKYWRS